MGIFLLFHFLIIKILEEEKEEENDDEVNAQGQQKPESGG